MNWNVPFINLKKQFSNQKKELIGAFENIMENGSFILRDDVNVFEENMAKFLNVRNVIGVNSGSDALILAAKTLNLKKNDEVITVAHTYIMTISSIFHTGATPVLVDIGDDYNIDVSKIESAINEKTKAIFPVHINGRMADMDSISRLAKKYSLSIVEDSAQGLGAKINNKNPGNFNSIGCFSSHPMKNLGCAGDGGFISTNDDKLANRLKTMRNHGQENKYEYTSYGFSSRLDTLQAAILNVKFPLFNSWIKKRREIARIYESELKNLPLVLPPMVNQKDKFFDVFSSYTIRTNNQKELHDYLRNKGVEVFIHLGPNSISENKNLFFKIPKKLVNTQKISKQVISLPIYPELDFKSLKYVIKCIKDFFNNRPNLKSPS
tara:strand:+ start:835 stop:1971 length:1137 start_codon:yes stop_codon:yes gene_type:complete